MKRILAVLIISIMTICFTACGTNAMQADESGLAIDYKFLTQQECADTLGNLERYYDNINQKSLDYFMQKKGATVDEYIEYSKEQACEFTADEQAALDEAMHDIEAKMTEAGMGLPENATVSIAASTMKEACSASGYTHDTTIFLRKDIAQKYIEGDDNTKTFIKFILAHELFHCLTRNNPDFRSDMYKFIGFTVNDSDYDIPENVAELMIVNPDVGHHDSYATFTINGEKKDCYLMFLTKDTFEKPGDSFFENMYTGLVSVDDGTLYSYEDASDFYDVVGENTTYCEDPEECMATNFGYAMVYGMDGPEGDGYKSPEIIENIIDYMVNLKQ